VELKVSMGTHRLEHRAMAKCQIYLTQKCRLKRENEFQWNMRYCTTCDNLRRLSPIGSDTHPKSYVLHQKGLFVIFVSSTWVVAFYEALYKHCKSL